MRKVVIVGGGSAGWMAAASFARFLPPGTAITVVESEAIGTVGVGEASIPSIRLFNQSLGIDEEAFLRATEGTIKLGIEFVDWSRPGSRYIHAFGSIGRSLGLVPFHHYWLRHRTEGGDGSLWDYAVSAVAAAADRFSPHIGRPELPTGLAWAFQFDATRYAAQLRTFAEQRGVARIEGEVVDVKLDEGNGDVIALALAEDDPASFAGGR